MSRRYCPGALVLSSADALRSMLIVGLAPADGFDVIVSAARKGSAKTNKQTNKQTPAEFLKRVVSSTQTNADKQSGKAKTAAPPLPCFQDLCAWRPFVSRKP